MTVRVLVLSMADPRFSTYQPPVWDKSAPEGRLAFSPEVCPGGRTECRLSVTSSALQTSTSIARPKFTTAQCCVPEITLA